METLIYLFGALVGIATTLAAIAIWAPRHVAMKAAALVVAALLMGTGYAGFLELLGRPKPASMEWVTGSTKEAKVLAAYLKEGEAIYIWLELNGRPRAYVLPWDRRLASQLQRARRQAQANGTAVRMRRPFAPGGDRKKPKFYAEPQPPLPPKSSASG